jgi:mono/diheme cytochrome c family protein/plastocyanin
MKRSELYTRILVGAALLGAVGIPLIFWARTPLIHASLAENGGWNPQVLHAKVGEPLQLRLTSDDVAHGFAVGQRAMPSVDVLPGKVTETTLNFEKPGTYTFYCTRWCGINHWRMRGTIEVTSSEPATAPPASVPLYVTLGLDLDAPHDAAILPEETPSSLQTVNNLPMDQFTNFASYSAHSPEQTWHTLGGNPSLSQRSDQQIWDLVAFIWQSNTTSANLTNGKQLYGQNCAACHGETGAGNGVFADDLAAAGQASLQTMRGAQNMSMQRPADFTDPRRMLGASPALLQGKILRGGMGTGMPSWGAIFNESQIWGLVAYLYSFQFEYR